MMKKLILPSLLFLLLSGCAFHFGTDAHGSTVVRPVISLSGRSRTHIGLRQVLPDESTTCPGEFRPWDITCAR